MSSNKISIAEPDLTGNEFKYLKGCIDTNWISSAGEFIERFEGKFAEFAGCKYGSSCSNGTAALHLALLALGIKEDDEVIIPNLTFAATANAVKYCNAKIVLADVDKETWNIDPEEIERKISSRTKAIIAVHLYGNPCDMSAIMETAKEKEIPVVEDCAEAHGALYKDRNVGSVGSVGCFSFYGNKTISTGEGGMCVSNDNVLIDKINLLKNHAMTKKQRYWHRCVGYNYRLTNLQAAVGLAQTERINSFIEKRTRLTAEYHKQLGSFKGIQFQKPTLNTKPIPWMYPILLDSVSIRDKLMVVLERAGIESRKVFYPLNEMPPYLDSSEFNNSKELSEKGLILPLHTNLSERQIAFICETIKKEIR